MDRIVDFMRLHLFMMLPQFWHPTRNNVPRIVISADEAIFSDMHAFYGC